LGQGSEAAGKVRYSSDRSLEGSRIKRDGLAAETPAPLFRLPRVDGGELCLDEYRGRWVLLVFSDPDCGPCNELAPELERLHRGSPDLQVVMVSRGDYQTNQRKVEQHALTFPVVLQRRWEISREYAMFATPIAYLIDEQGVIAADVAMGGGAILALAGVEEQIMHERIQTRLEALRKEFETGQAELDKAEKQVAYLRETVLRISGAVQVLEELLAEEHSVEQRNGTDPANPESVTVEAPSVGLGTGNEQPT
jgi:peroxiredoxin